LGFVQTSKSIGSVLKIDSSAVHRVFLSLLQLIKVLLCLEVTFEFRTCSRTLKNSQALNLSPGKPRKEVEVSLHSSKKLLLGRVPLDIVIVIHYKI
jgi:hypothetical protein